MSSVSLIIYIACFGIVCNSVVEVRVWLGTTIVIVVISSTSRVISGLVFFSFELTALVLIVTWFFIMVARWFGLVRVLPVELVASQYLWASRLELPNHSILTPFQDATQSVHTCRFPNAPD